MHEDYIPINLDDWDLHRAAEENRADIARLLISAGAEFSYQGHLRIQRPDQLH